MLDRDEERLDLSSVQESILADEPEQALRSLRSICERRAANSPQEEVRKRWEEAVRKLEA